MAPASLISLSAKPGGVEGAIAAERGVGGKGEGLARSERLLHLPSRNGAYGSGVGVPKGVRPMVTSIRSGMMVCTRTSAGSTITSGATW